MHNRFGQSLYFRYWYQGGCCVRKTEKKSLSTGHHACIFFQANVPVSNLVPAVDKKNVARSYQNNDLVCCEILEISPDSCRLVCGMRNVYKQIGEELGLISIEAFPDSYK
jgi:hypothetical protein